jgi:hypothetical protein
MQSLFPARIFAGGALVSSRVAMGALAQETNLAKAQADRIHHRDTETQRSGRTETTVHPS